MALKLNWSRTAGVGCLVLFALPFIAFGAGMSVWSAHMVSQYRAMQSWVETPATIKSAELKTKRGRKDGSTYQALATYDYEFGGNRFTGDRVTITSGSDNFGTFQRDTHAELKRHLDQRKPFRCYVDPKNPRNAVLYRTLRGEMLTFLSLFGAVFGSVGAGLLTFGIVGMRQLPTHSAEVEASAEPWLARGDWATGQIRASGGAAVAAPVLAVVALYWNFAALPVYWKLADSFTSEPGLWRWFASIFPVVGGALVLAFIYQLLRGRKYGESVLQLAGTPGIIGGQLAGVVRIANDLQPADGFRLTLSCIERATTRKGKSQENLLWQDERLVTQPMRDDATAATAVPVLFAIPYECLESSRPDSNRDVRWRLDVRAKMPGVDYSSRFEVPVYKTSASRKDFQLDEHLAADFAPPPSRDLLLSDAHIAKKPLAGNGVRLVFPAARNLASAVMLTMVLLLWSGAIWLMLQKGVFPLVPVIFGLVGLVFAWIALDLWFYRSVVEASPDGLRGRGGWLGMGREWSLAADEIRRFTTEEYMSTGSSVWNNVLLVPRSGKKRLIAKGIGSKLARQAVIDELNAALGRG